MDKKKIAKLSAQDVKTRFADAPYYDNVEAQKERQWKNIIYPLIKDYDFTRVLELAPGHGRNTNKLMETAKEIMPVDANETCIEFCKDRFKDYKMNVKGPFPLGS